MFKNKHLKRLRKVQFLIKHYKASIEKLKSPVPDSYRVLSVAYDVLHPILWGRSFNPDEVLELSDASIKYISQLGQYLMDIADHVDTKKLYEKQIKQLQQEECILKEKLGIE